MSVQHGALIIHDKLDASYRWSFSCYAAGRTCFADWTFGKTAGVVTEAVLWLQL
jgi:hypothetical protein